jgi:hypothetical protein
MHDGAREAHEGVAPCAHLTVPEVLVPDVDPAEERHLAVDDDELAVVAEVDLEAVVRPACRLERVDPGARGA